MQINQLPTIPQAPANADVLAIEVNGVTYKVSKQTLAAAIAANITPADIGAKAAQTAVPSPTASDNASAFIDTITQDTQGKITVTKKNVTPASIGALALSGGTVTGAVTRKVNVDFATPPAAEEWNGIIPYTDSSSDVKGGVYNLRETDGSYRTMLGARGANGWGYIAATIDSSGNQGYVISHPQAMLTALNIRWTKVTGTTSSGGTIGLGLARNQYMVVSAWSSVSSGNSHIVTPLVTAGGTNWTALVETISHTAVASTSVTLYVGYIDFGAGNIS